MTEPSPLSGLAQLAKAGDLEAFVSAAAEVHPSDLADVLVELEEDVRLGVIAALPPELASEALAEMEPDEHPEELLAALAPQDAASIVAELEDDDAADLIGDLPAEAASTILASVDDPEEIRRLLVYDEESAGGIMTSAVVAVPEWETTARAIELIREQSAEVEEFYQVYCIGAGDTLVGVLPLQRLVRAPAATTVRDIMEPVVAAARPEQDQEEVARLIARYNLASVPVVDTGGRLLGRITFDDVIDVVEAEQTEDLLKFGGVSEDEELGGPWHQAVRMRLPWLAINLLTASLSAGVVSVFKHSVESLWALAALVPVVAGLGGNAGTQALAVTVRRVSLGLIPREQARRVVGKELLVGMVNGMVVGLTVGVAAWLLQADWRFGIVVLSAMWGNLMVAGCSGASIPLVLERLGYDPAVASSVFVTAFTDVCGYLLLFGLATWLIL